MFKYMLPNERNGIEYYYTEYNSVIIIGANGSGKSKLGAWMELQDQNNIHRISAQRSLDFKDYIELKSFEQAERLMLYGTLDHGQGKNPRWKWGNYTTTLLNDFEYALSALIAFNNLQYSNFVNDCRIAESNKKEHPNVPVTVIDNLKNIWDNVFPHRKINFYDSKVLTSFTIASEGQEKRNIEYKGNQMSDGERVALYLISQCLCVPKNKIIIIDEPEIHLHRSIMNKLWSEIEKIRKDCLFIYITHDTHFAASHVCSDKIWVKEFDGEFWKLEKVKDSDLPEQMLLDIVGNRKNVLFVEGTSESFDTKVYREIYNNYYIVPCGSCISVINYTKAFNKTSQLHDLKCFGLIDRDYRSDYEIEKLKEDNVFCLNVAEVENIFIASPVLNYINSSLNNIDDSKVIDVKKYVVEERFFKDKEKQIYSSVISQIKYKLSILDISKNSLNDLSNKLENISKYLEYDKMLKELTEKYNSISSIEQYDECLLLYNCKKLSSSIGHFLGLKDSEYCDWILRKLKSNDKEELIEILLEYLPSEI